MSFGDEVRRLRKGADMSQVQLAELSGITQSAVTQIETGAMGTVSVQTLYRLCDALKVTPDHFRPFLANSEQVPVRPISKRK